MLRIVMVVIFLAVCVGGVVSVGAEDNNLSIQREEGCLLEDNQDLLSITKAEKALVDLEDSFRGAEDEVNFLEEDFNLVVEGLTETNDNPLDQSWAEGLWPE